jgi:hypothetical protein
MKLTFLGPSVRDPQNKGATTGRLVNCYREPVQAGGRTQFAVRSVPGMQPITDFAYFNTVTDENVRKRFQALPAPVTYLAPFYNPIGTADNRVDYMFYTHGQSAGYFTTEGVTAAVGALAISGTPIRRIGNMTTGGDYVIRTDGTTVQHTGITTAGTTTNLGAINRAGSVSYLSGYAILTERNGRKIQWSEPYDLDSFPALNFATAEADGQPLIRGITVGSLFIAFKDISASFWQLTGGAGADALAVIPGRELSIGLRAFRLLTEIPDGCAFCGSDGKVYVFRGGLQQISTPALESALVAHTPRDMFYYEWFGHGFICVTFDDIPAWCYDTAMGEWHERSGPDGGPWDARCAAKFTDHWCFGYGNGEIYVASQWLRDGTKPLVREMITGTLDTGREVRVDKIEIGARVADGPIDTTDRVAVTGDNVLELYAPPPPYSATGAEPTPGLMVQTSRDGGHNWGMIRTRTLGAIGKYDTRIVLRNLGQHRRPCLRITLASPVDTPVYSDAEIEVS